MAEMEPSGEQIPLPFDRRTELIPVGTLYEQADENLLARLRNEDRRFERKSAGIQAQVLGDYLSILANSPPDGGLIAIGIEDDGSFGGCARTHPKHLNELERAGDIHCPDARYGCKHVGIQNKEGEEDFILLIRVQYRSDKLVETVRGLGSTRRI